MAVLTSTHNLCFLSRNKTNIVYPCKSLFIYTKVGFKGVKIIQYNLNGSNTDGSFTVDDSNSFFSPYKILPIAEENKYLMIFFILSYNCMLCASMRRF